MKRFLLFALAAVMFAACAEDALTEQSGIQPIVDEAPETLTIGFEGDDETRIQLNEQTKTVWTKDDIVSVFYKSDANQKWQYQGETGERVGTLKRVDAGTATARMDRVVVVYPYSDDYLINLTTGDIETTMPATQTYLKDSYGLDGNIMVSSDYFTQISLKNVCGWLKLQLTGDGEKVKSITFKGNSGEQVAGLIYINTSNATAILASKMGGSNDSEIGGVGGSLVFDDTILTEVTLNCGEGVELGSEATSFYIALPPQTFSDGFTVEIEATDGSTMTKSTDKVLPIERNTIQPMKAFVYSRTSPANNEIWYTNGSTTTATTPNKTDVFGANIVSNIYDTEKECWVIKFDADVTVIGDRAFYGYDTNCKNLTSVAIPNSVTAIGNYAFYYCNSLTSVTIPESVTKIGDTAFGCCESLEDITIPNSVTTVQNWAFSSCSNLASATIGEEVTAIGEGVFSYCYNLAEFRGKYAVDNGRCLIKDNTIIAYANASGTEYTIPDGVSVIEKSAFRGCRDLATVTIPISIITINVNAFLQCDSLMEVYCKPTTPPSAIYFSNYWNAFPFNDSLHAIYVPIGSVDTYKSASGWSEYADCIVGYNF